MSEELFTLKRDEPNAAAQFGQARPWRAIHSGDVLLFRRRVGDLSGEAIAVAGRTIYSHAAMAGWWSGDLMLLHTVQWRGGESLLLENVAAAQPGRIDVYGLAPEFRGRYDRRAAVHAARLATGKPYGRAALIGAGLRHLPLVRWFVRPEMDDAVNGRLPFCSMGVARWMRAGGVDPVPNLADRLTEPGDLARSAALTYRFTLR